MIKNKKQMFIVITSFILIMLLTTVTYAFFNYTRTGVSNTIKVGRINFITRQNETINLTNVFPIASSEATGENPNYGEVVIEIVGDTDYSEGIEYLVSAVDSNIYTTEGKIIPISLDIKVNGLGIENNNYFTAREAKDTTIYKNIVGSTFAGDGRLLVGYIKPNTTSGTIEGINGTITIKAYLDKDKILISDTYDGTESDNMGTTKNKAYGKTVITTSEWNDLQQNGVSFKIKVEANEGIWINQTFNDVMKTKSIDPLTNRPIMDNVQSEFVSLDYGIDFRYGSSNINGKGVYMHAGTENNPFPIIYYRGDVDDNNVLFAGFCWKIVRTTDTGGIKLLYDGEVGTVYKDDNYDLTAYKDVVIEGNPFEFDTYANEWKVELDAPFLWISPGLDEASLKFKVAEAGNYTLKFNYPGYGPMTVKRGETNIQISTGENLVELNNLTTDEEINISYKQYDFFSDAKASIIRVALNKGQIDAGVGCGNLGENEVISLDGQTKFAFNSDKQNYTVMQLAYAGYMYGQEYEYKNGAENDIYYSDSFEYADFDGNNTSEYKLKGDLNQSKDRTRKYSCGETSIDGTCNKLRYYVDSNASSKYYIELENGIGIDEAVELMRENTNDSIVKTVVDTWYSQNMTRYTNYLEDTIWCNYRSMSPPSIAGQLHFNDFTVQNKISFDCEKKDSFTVDNSHGNKKLQYPSALLTYEEMALAGFFNNENSYLNEKYFYSMTPNDWWGDSINNITIHVASYSSSLTSAYVRPSISLKNGTQFVRGSGTSLDPYVVE